MAESQNNQEIANGHFRSASPSPDDGRNWTPMMVGAVLVLAAVALVAIFTRSKTVSNQPDPYAARLQVSNLHMATAQNFAGGSVTYIEGTLTNSGDKKVVGSRVHVVFKNSLGEIVQDDVLPVMGLQPDTPIVDYGPLDRAPIAPGQKRDFRLTLEHITADWNGQIPEVKVVTANRQ